MSGHGGAAVATARTQCPRSAHSRHIRRCALHAVRAYLRARGPHPLAAPPCLAKARTQGLRPELAAERGEQRSSRSSEWRVKHSMHDGAREDRSRRGKMKLPTNGLAADTIAPQCHSCGRAVRPMEDKRILAREGVQTPSRGYSGVLRQMVCSLSKRTSGRTRPCTLHVARHAGVCCCTLDCCGYDRRLTLQENIVHLGYVLLEDRVSGGPSAPHKFTREPITRRLLCLTPPRWQHAE